MPGSQEILLLGRLGKYDLSMKIRPESRWRYLKFIGPLIQYRLGATVTFRVDIQTKKIGPDNPPWTDHTNMNDSVRLRLFLNGVGYGLEQVEFEVPPAVGGKFSMTTKPFFLQVVGDGELRYGRGSEQHHAFYVFRVWEPALSVVNWGMALLAGGFGAVIVWAIGALIGSDATPPS